MPELIDQYFLVDTRDTKFVTRFLDKYVPKREAICEYYIISTEYGEDEIEPENLDFVLLFYEHHVNTSYYIYLRNLDEDSLIAFAILTYTDDAKMVLGVSVIGSFNDVDDMRENTKIFNDIKAFTNSDTACMVLEEPPPSNTAEFIEFAELWKL